MNVQDIMTSPVQFCSPEDTLATVAKQMWDGDCGILPVVNDQGKVIGLITDRDMCISLATKNKLASEVSVWETISGNVFSCRPDDDIIAALGTMEQKQVRRLPVMDDEGLLVGIVSMNDIVVHAEEVTTMRKPSYSYRDIVQSMEGICTHRPTVATV